MTTSFTSRRLATSYEILVARTEFLVALATRKAQFRTLLLDTFHSTQEYRFYTPPSAPK